MFCVHFVATKTPKNQISGSIAIPKKNESSIFSGFNEPKIIGIGPVFPEIWLREESRFSDKSS